MSWISGPCNDESGEVSEAARNVEQPGDDEGLMESSAHDDGKNQPRWDRVMANSGSHWVSLNWVSERAPTPGDGAGDH